jgi:tetratricopeptide (TPR) repeat protein
MNLGFHYGTARHYEEARVLAEKLGISDDKNITSRLEDGPEKKRYYLERVTRPPASVDAHNHLGYIFWKEGDYTRAIEEFETAVSLKPDFATAHANLARVLIDLGRLDEATEKLLQVRELNPAQSVLNMVAGQLKIIRLLRKIEYEGDHTQLYMALGQAHYENGEIFESIDAVIKAAELQPDEPTIYLNLANLYERVQFVDEIAEVYEKLLQLRPNDEQSRARAAQLAGLRGNIAAKQQFLNTMLPQFFDEREDSDHPESCAEALRMWDDFDFDGKITRENLKKAAALFEESIDAKSDDTHAYHDAATLYEILGDYERAAALWRRSPRPSPDDRAAERHARRLELLAEVSRGGLPAGDEARALSEIGILYRIGGEIERAAEFTERSLDKDPSQVVVWVALAEILLEAGNYEKALDSATRALQLKPDHPGAAEIIEQLGLVGVSGGAS